MAHLTIRTIPDPVLRERAKEVEKVDDEIVHLMRDMLETMYADHGVGLAANQVGVLKRVIVVDVSEERDGSHALLMANPEILEASDETFTYREGCLSVRPEVEDFDGDFYADVVRPQRIRVAYLDEKNQRRELVAADFLSTCLQHEIDHLNGVLFIDHISALKRNIIKRKIEKARKDT